MDAVLGNRPDGCDMSLCQTQDCTVAVKCSPHDNGQRASLLGARLLLGAPGLTTSNKKLPGAKDVAARNRDACSTANNAHEPEPSCTRPFMRSTHYRPTQLSTTKPLRKSLMQTQLIHRVLRKWVEEAPRKPALVLPIGPKGICKDVLQTYRLSVSMVQLTTCASFPPASILLWRNNAGNCSAGGCAREQQLVSNIVLAWSPKLIQASLHICLPR